MISNLKREKLLVISNIATMTITFLVLGAFITVIALTQTGIKMLEKQAQITVFFKDEFSEGEIVVMKSALEKDERVESVNYISKEDAFKIFAELNKDDPLLLESISASILPASLEIRTKNIADLQVFAEELSNQSGVEEVKYFKDVIERFKKWSTVSYVVGAVLTAVFLIISFSVVMVTLRISISSKGKELEVLKLVGASDNYVKKPIIRQGMFFGITSALIASMVILLISLIFQITSSLRVNLGFLPVELNVLVFGLFLSILLMMLGLALGYFGSAAAIKRYLKY